MVVDGCTMVASATCWFIACIYFKHRMERQKKFLGEGTGIWMKRGCLWRAICLHMLLFKRKGLQFSWICAWHGITKAVVETKAPFSLAEEEIMRWEEQILLTTEKILFCKNFNSLCIFKLWTNHFQAHPLVSEKHFWLAVYYILFFVACTCKISTINSPFKTILDEVIHNSVHEVGSIWRSGITFCNGVSLWVWLTVCSPQMLFKCF